MSSDIKRPSEIAQQKIADLNIRDVGQSLGAIIVGIYTLGFIVYNTYIGTYGIVSYEIFRAQYLAAGAITAIIFSIFWFAIGRRIVNRSEDAKKLIDITNSFRYASVWRLLISLFAIVEICFSVIVATVWVSSLLFAPSKDFILLMSILSGFFLIDYLVFVNMGLYTKLPQYVIPMVGLMYLGLILWTSLEMQNPVLWKIVGFFVVCAFVCDVIIDIHRKTHRTQAFTIFWIFTSLLVAATYVGGQLYGLTKASIGGGTPVPIRLVISTNTPDEIKQILMVKNISELRLLGENDREVWLLVGQKSTEAKVLRLNREWVAAILPNSNSEALSVK